MNQSPESPLPVKKRYVRAVGPRLRILLMVVFGLFALLGANSVYLSSITFLTWLDRDKGVSYENYFYQFQFLAHLVLGLLIVGIALGNLVGPSAGWLVIGCGLIAAALLGGRK